MRTIASLVSICLLAAILSADCPTPVEDTAAWSNGNPISYSWPSSNPPPAWTALSVDTLGIAGDINGAFNQWTYADQSQNSTNVTFYSAGSGTPITIYAYQVNSPPDGDPLQAAQYTLAVFTGTSTIAGQAITLYFGSTCGDGAYPCWDQNGVNFHRFVQQVMAHEVGHGMGLTDEPLRVGTCAGQTAGESVMNAQCETNDNDGNLPAPAAGLPDCDNQSVW